MGRTTGKTGKFAQAFMLSAGFALSGCATTQLNTETCMEGTGYQGRFLSYSSGTTFQEFCSLGKTAAATVNIRGKDGNLKPTAPVLDENFRKTLPPEALTHYDFFLKQHGITLEALKKAAESQSSQNHGDDHGLICKTAGATTVCDLKSK
jgi:hypothetical protein